MSRMVAGLARSRLIAITKDPQDARRMQIRATAKGARLLQAGRERRIAYLAEHLDSLTPEDLNCLGKAVEILAGLLQKWG